MSSFFIVEKPGVGQSGLNFDGGENGSVFQGQIHMAVLQGLGVKWVTSPDKMGHFTFYQRNPLWEK